MLIAAKRPVALAGTTAGVKVKPSEPIISWLAIYTHAIVGALYLMAWLHGSAFATVPLAAGWAGALVFQLKARRTHSAVVAATPLLAFVAWAIVAKVAPGALGL